MATAIGDLVVSLGVDNQQFISALGTSGANLDEFAGHTGRGSRAMQEFGERGEETAGHVHGAHRAMGFLGRQIKEVGEGLGESNSALGETVTGLGSTVSGLGEAMHGYHALHTAIQVATGAQVFLNSISPLGWAALAAGAVAVGYAYATMGHNAETAEEETKRLKKALGELGSERGSAFDRGAEEKTKELQDKLSQAKQDQEHGTVSGYATLGIDFLLQEHAITSAKTALTEFTEAVKRHKQEEASKEVDSALDHLRDQAEKLNETPLQKFQEELQATGRSATAIADATAKFKELSAQIEGHKIDDELGKKERELRESGMSAGQRFATGFEASHPGASSAQRERAESLGAREDQMKLEEKQRQDAAAEREHAAQQAKSLIESAQSPMDKMIQQAKTLQENFQRSLLDRATYETALGALGQKAEGMRPKEQQAKDEGPAAALEYNSAAAYQEMFRVMNPEENQPAEQTAENTAKTNELLATIANAINNAPQLKL